MHEHLRELERALAGGDETARPHLISGYARAGREASALALLVSDEAAAPATGESGLWARALARLSPAGGAFTLAEQGSLAEVYAKGWSGDVFVLGIDLHPTSGLGEPEPERLFAFRLSSSTLEPAEPPAETATGNVAAGRPGFILGEVGRYTRCLRVGATWHQTPFPCPRGYWLYGAAPSQQRAQFFQSYQVHSLSLGRRPAVPHVVLDQRGERLAECVGFGARAAWGQERLLWLDGDVLCSVPFGAPQGLTRLRLTGFQPARTAFLEPLDDGRALCVQGPLVWEVTGDAWGRESLSPRWECSEGVNPPYRRSLDGSGLLCGSGRRAPCRIDGPQTGRSSLCVWHPRADIALTRLSDGRFAVEEVDGSAPLFVLPAGERALWTWMPDGLGLLSTRVVDGALVLRCWRAADP